MKHLLTSRVTMAVVFPLLGIVGTLVSLSFPAYHGAFCAGIAAAVI